MKPLSLSYIQLIYLSLQPYTWATTCRSRRRLCLTLYPAQYDIVCRKKRKVEERYEAALKRILEVEEAFQIPITPPVKKYTKAPKKIAFILQVELTNLPTYEPQSPEPEKIDVVSMKAPKKTRLLQYFRSQQCGHMRADC